MLGAPRVPQLANCEARRVVGRAVADTVDPELRVFMKPGHGRQVLPDRPGDPQSSDAGLSPLVGAHPLCAACGADRPRCPEARFR